VRASIAGMADVKPFDYALYLTGELGSYLEDRADDLSGKELASLQAIGADCSQVTGHRDKDGVSRRLRR